MQCDFWACTRVHIAFHIPGKDKDDNSLVNVSSYVILGWNPMRKPVKKKKEENRFRTGLKPLHNKSGNGVAETSAFQ